MKNNLFFALFFFPTLLFSQSRHDLKIDLFQGFLRTAILSSESTPSKLFGIELGVVHEWGIVGCFTGASSSDNDYQLFPHYVVHVSLMVN